MGAMPEPKRQLEHGQCETPVRLLEKRFISCLSNLTQWACQTSFPVQPSSSAYCPGLQPNFSKNRQYPPHSQQGGYAK